MSQFISHPDMSSLDFNSIEPYLEVIRLGSGPEVESLAGEVPADKIHLLIAYYYHTQDWDEKCAVVDMLRFDEHSDLPAMMLDFLRAPKEFHDDASKEYILLAKAFALGFIADEYDQLEAYYNDLRLLRQDIAKVLEAEGLSFYPLDIAGHAELARKAGDAMAQEDAIYSAPAQAQLIFAIQEGKLELALRALRNGAEVNALVTEGNYQGMSMLMLALSRATSHGNLDIIELLLDQRADIHVIRTIRPEDAPDKGQTALWWAANLGDASLVRRLLAAGADPNIPDQHGSTAFLQAASGNHCDVATLLREAGAKTDARISDGRNAIQLACNNGHTSMVKMLLDAGEDVNQAPSSSGFTLLMTAVSSNHVELARLLIARGADVNAVHSGGSWFIAATSAEPERESLRSLALEQGYHDLVHRLEQNNIDFSVVQENGEWRIRDLSTSVYRGYRGYTPLVFAVASGYVRLVELLVEAGADVHHIVPEDAEQGTPARRLTDFLGGRRSDEVILKLLQASSY